MYIYAFSKKLKDIAADLDEKSEQIIIHLIKLYLYPENDSVLHWRQEVYNFLYTIPSIKGKNKLPSADFIFKNTWETGKQWLSSYINHVIGEYGYPDSDTDYSPQEISNVCEAYFTWLSEMLSTNKIISRQDVYAELSALGM